MGRRKSKNNKKVSHSWRRSLDLHGLRVEEALCELDRFLNQCLMDEAVHKIEVIHGIGSGKIKKAVLTYLKGISIISGFQEDPHNPGVTWIDL
jgi:DNA mismatch repair protein MutS2